jgi:deoxyribodipyrimidine photo-lyase
MHPKDLSDDLRELAEDPRVTIRRGGPPEQSGKCVVYWMQRSQRGWDSHALDLAVKLGNLLALPVVAYFAGISNFRAACWRHYAFLNQGLPSIQEDLAERNVTFVLRNAPHESHERLLADVQAAICIGDENPMREPESWRKGLAERLRIPFWTVDNDVIVPTRLIAKAQYAAYTIRPRLYRVLPDFLKQYENLKAEKPWHMPTGFLHDDPREDMTRNWKDFDRSVRPVEAWTGGRPAAMKRLEHFVTRVLPNYEETRNQPEVDGTSKLSPYLHFGHVGPLTIALAVERALKTNPKLAKARDGFFNELIVWRELAVNFVQYTPNYDTADCAEPWARQTIAEHARDERERLYTLKQLETAQTYDELWNAAQIQMVEHGWMHNRLRMYWAKKILEWTPDVATAVKYAVHLNDKYFLDGRDPNGYAGVAWSMLGKFDRPWFERPVFGKIRYMSGASTGKKFDSKRYIREMQELRDGEFRLH